MAIFGRKNRNDSMKTDSKDDLKKFDSELRHKSQCNEKVLVKVNSLLEYMIQMDYVRDMIKDVNHQTDLLEEIAASGQELSASTEEISSFVQESNRMSSDSSENAHKALADVNTMFAEIDENMAKTARANEAMKSVNVEAKKIVDIVQIIESVADQTNLLALNASIEAARAGVHPDFRT